MQNSRRVLILLVAAFVMLGYGVHMMYEDRQQAKELAAQEQAVPAEDILSVGVNSDVALFPAIKQAEFTAQLPEFTPAVLQIKGWSPVTNESYFDYLRRHDVDLRLTNSLVENSPKG